MRGDAHLLCCVHFHLTGDYHVGHLVQGWHACDNHARLISPEYNLSTMNVTNHVQLLSSGRVEEYSFRGASLSSALAISSNLHILIVSLFTESLGKKKWECVYVLLDMPPPNQSTQYQRQPKPTILRRWLRAESHHRLATPNNRHPPCSLGTYLTAHTWPVRE